MDCYGFVPFVTLPATCELCHQWIPNHAANCPRKGKPPSQWSRGDTKQEAIEDDNDEQLNEEEDC
ncbi:unnamed protein product [Umbelopsis vinacea]